MTTIVKMLTHYAAGKSSSAQLIDERGNAAGRPQDAQGLTIQAGHIGMITDDAEAKTLIESGHAVLAHKYTEGNRTKYRTDPEEEIAAGLKREEYMEAIDAELRKKEKEAAAEPVAVAVAAAVSAALKGQKRGG